MSLRSSLYVGSVFHRRFAPKAHYFHYRLCWLLIDLDELATLDSRLRLFSHNRANLFSLNDRDHGNGGTTPLRQQVEQRLAENGIDIKGGAVRLLCMPRTLGVGFNPLSVYWCYRHDGALAALIYQVHNTFGERHSYVLPASQTPGETRQGCDKAFFVSPFLPMGLRYEFRVSPPGEALMVAIRALGPQGVALQAAIAGRRRELSDRALLRVGFLMPLVALKTIAAIHWQALRLLLKGVPFLGRSGAGANRQIGERPHAGYRASRGATRRAVWAGAVSGGLVVAALALGQFATLPNLSPWYAALQKPSFNPPNAIFGPAWTALYALMAFALWRVLRLPASTPGRNVAIAAFLTQLALNVAWSFLFFAAHSPLLGLVDIVPQLAAILVTMAAIWRVDRLAGACLAPLAGWVAFATLLNVAIWRLN